MHIKHWIDRHTTLTMPDGKTYTGYVKADIVHGRYYPSVVNRHYYFETEAGRRIDLFKKFVYCQTDKNPHKRSLTIRQADSN